MFELQFLIPALSQASCSTARWSCTPRRCARVCSSRELRSKKRRKLPWYLEFAQKPMLLPGSTDITQLGDIFALESVPHSTSCAAANRSAHRCFVAPAVKIVLHSSEKAASCHVCTTSTPHRRALFHFAADPNPA